MMTRNAVRNTLSNLISNLNNLNSQAVINQLEDLIQDLRSNDDNEVKPAPRLKRDADDKEISPLLSQIKLLLDSPVLSRNCVSFTSQYLKNKWFTLDGALTVLNRMKEEIEKNTPAGNETVTNEEFEMPTCTEEVLF